MRTIERFEARRKARRRVLLAAAAGVLCAACAAAYFVFPAEAESVVRIARATVERSWKGAVGGSAMLGGTTYTIDLTAGNSGQEIGIDDNAGEGVAEERMYVVGNEVSTTTGPIDGKSDGLAEIDAAATASPPTTTARSSSEPVLAPRSAPVPVAAPSTVNAGERFASSTPPSQLCDLTVSSSLAPSRKVLLNEIAWMGSPPLAGETASKAANREWIELRNTTNAAADISGWQIQDGAGKIDIVLAGDSGGGTAIPAAGFYLLERGGGPAASGTLPGVAAEAGYSGALANAGGVLVLFDEACGVVDRVDAPDGWPGGDNAAKMTLERNDDGYGWHTSAAAGGTPGAGNSPPPPPAATAIDSASSAATTTTISADLADAEENSSTATSTPETSLTTVCYAMEATSTGATSTSVSDTASSSAPTSTMDTASSSGFVSHLVIAEVQIAGEASNNDFVKIFDPMPEAVDVSGWKLRKRSKSGAEYSLRVLPEGSVVPPRGYFVWANAGGGFGDVVGADATSTATLAADNSVALIDADGSIVDAVAWGEGTGQYMEGTAYPSNPEAGQVLKRRFADGAVVDTDDNTNDFAL